MNKIFVFGNPQARQIGLEHWEKNPTYGKHWISRRMRVVIFFYRVQQNIFWGCPFFNGSHLLIFQLNKNGGCPSKRFLGVPLNFHFFAVKIYIFFSGVPKQMEGGGEGVYFKLFNFSIFFFIIFLEVLHFFEGSKNTLFLGGPININIFFPN